MGDREALENCFTVANFLEDPDNRALSWFGKLDQNAIDIIIQLASDPPPPPPILFVVGDVLRYTDLFRMVVGRCQFA